MSTIYDIAKIAGVSATTVSKVFNDYKEVSQKTKDNVNRIAKEIGYVPNLGARSTRTKRSFLVGIVFSEDVGLGLEHQFFSVVLEAFRKEIGKKGYDTIFINKTVGKKDIGYLDHSKYRNVEGLFIITAKPNEMDYKKLIDSDFKCVTTDMKLEGVPTILSDNYGGVQQALDYLREMGHERIGHIAGPKDTIAGQERQAAFTGYIKDHNLDKSMMPSIEARNFDRESAHMATLDLLKDFDVDKGPTALFVSADLMAIGAIEAIKSRGLSVPEDISIIGFDDLEISDMLSPKLTTIKQDKHAIGKSVANTLYKMIEEDSYKWEEARIPTCLIVRESVRNIK
jgi:LacI family transcriptional regulator